MIDVPALALMVVLDAEVVGLLLLVGTLNLAALLRPGSYAPVGWRSGIVPRRLRGSTHPAAVIAVGVILGLVCDTATQAAAWGTAATVAGGPLAVLGIVAAFAVGMIATDTLDSQIVGRLLRSLGKSSAVIDRYRRAVGWLVVALSYGIAALALFEAVNRNTSVSDQVFTVVGISAGGLVIALFVIGRCRGDTSSSRRRTETTQKWQLGGSQPLPRNGHPIGAAVPLAFASVSGESVVMPYRSIPCSAGSPRCPTMARDAGKMRCRGSGAGSPPAAARCCSGWRRSPLRGWGTPRRRCSRASSRPRPMRHCC